MALSGLKADVEIEAPADKVYEFYTCKPYEMNKSSPEKIQSVDLIEGQWGKDGSVYCWNFLLDGKTTNNKVKVGIDNQNKSVTYKTMEGTLTKSFKSFIISMKITPTTEQGSLVHWTLDYEKLNANVEDPKSMLQIVVDCCKDAGVYLNNKAKTQSSPLLQTN